MNLLLLLKSVEEVAPNMVLVLASSLNMMYLELVVFGVLLLRVDEEGGIVKLHRLELE